MFRNFWLPLTMVETKWRWLATQYHAKLVYLLLTWATVWSQLSLFVALAAGLSYFTAGCHVKSVPPTPSQTEAWVCSTMGESTRSSPFYNPTLSANKHVVQICRFSLSPAADLADGSRERRTSPFNGDVQSLSGIERSLTWAEML